MEDVPPDPRRGIFGINKEEHIDRTPKEEFREIIQRAAPPREDYHEERRGGLLVNLPLILAVFALLISLFSIYVAYSNSQKTITSAELLVSVPLKGSVQVYKEIPASDALPTSVVVPFDFEIPVNETVLLNIPGVGIRNVPLETVIHIRKDVTIDFRSLDNETIIIQTEIPIDTNVSGTLKVGE